MSSSVAARLARLTLLAGAAALIAGCGGRASAPRPSVVLISIDTLRADHLAAWGYGGVATPAIDGLAHDALRFANAYAHYPLTLPSHVSLLTGLLPPRHGVRDNVGYTLDAAAHPTLARRFADAGYDTGGFVSSYVLRGETGLAAGFAAYDAPGLGADQAILDLAQRPGARTVAAARSWLAARGGHPFFLFVHLYEPHAPYDPPEPWKSRYADPYDGEIATADAAVGALLAELRDRGLYAAAVVALVSDHGEGLGDHGENKHGVFLYRSTLHVPLLLKLPGGARAGTTVAAPVGLVDVVPTLAALAGLDAAGDTDGTDLLAAPPPARGLYAETLYPRFHFGMSDLRAWTESRWSLVDGPRPELFDLAADPGQTVDRLDGERREAARMRAEIARHDRPITAPSAVDAETARRLAALGYLTGGVAADADLPDPRTQRDLLADLETGSDAFFRGDDATALPLLRKALERNPKMRDVWGFVARALDRQGRPAEAIAAWDRVLELAGGDPETALLVGERWLELGDVAKARGLAETAARALPERADELLAEIELAEGRASDAAVRLERAVAAGTASETTRRRLALDALRRGDAAHALELLKPLEEGGKPESWILLALALSETGRQQEGLAVLDRARGASHPESAFFENLGVALLALDRLDRARTAFEEAVRRDPAAATAWNALGVARARTHDPRGALAAWQRAVAAEPRLVDAWFNLGLTAAGVGDRRLARHALGRYLELTPVEERFAADRARAAQALGALGGAG